MATEPVDYCREVETHLCQKNDGHLVRIVGPSFELVSGWAALGVPIKVAFEGIDRYFERYYRMGPRRRPVRIDFCEADVFDAFDEWRRALGLSMTSESPVSGQQAPAAGRQSSVSLPAHLERVVLRLTSRRAGGALSDAFDGVIDRVARELDVARAGARGVRGDARQALIGRLAELDRELLETARAALDETARSALSREADEALAGFRVSMVAEAYARAREAAIDRLVRGRFGLPTVAFD